MTSPDAAIEVVGAVIVRGGLVLCARRGPHGDLAGMWEFPGGKVEPGESPAEALRREIAEELGCDIRVGARVVRTVHPQRDRTIALTTYWSTIERGTPVAHEHAELRWVRRAHLPRMQWAPADLEAVAQVARTPVTESGADQSGADQSGADQSGADQAALAAPTDAADSASASASTAR